jgi:hypothetical protein
MKFNRSIKNSEIYAMNDCEVDMDQGAFFPGFSATWRIDPRGPAQRAAHRARVEMTSR